MFQAENKKYRTERTRLIEERNNNYSKIRALYVKEDEIKKEIAVVRGDISANRKCKRLKKHSSVRPSWYRDEDDDVEFCKLSYSNKICLFCHK